MTHPAIEAGKVAIITGGASGIGLAAAKRLGGAGMKIVLVDLAGERLEQAVAELRNDGIEAVAVGGDVSERATHEAAKAAADGLGATSILMSNAGIGGEGQILGSEAAWQRTLGTNIWGSVHAVQVNLPDMIASVGPAAVICTGSKQGITLPPGDTAYNVSKAALRAFTESLSHDLVTDTGGRVTAHLLIPGWTFTGLTAADPGAEKPAGAWTADQVADYMIEGMDRGDFYLLCPDNDVDRPTDEKRMLWHAGDIVENRPALSRWHPDHAAAFDAFMKG
ncbi:SDR family NAD(P)-dependent oxidoreductase [Pelagovum pacificum]|uniref:SDR family NAD(P)-dependent oxidoreductase n=1 Tax=Pelagovum pacificum TaxID=2588711 RepID=A0A5C5G7P4_9RHOB|nr:SDR family NAD(P)-dependent oxidoreductase [Pelagovum pacificum]QQA41822.1 SDR family NAD(P)-dependent oxidoreductase [Pelagovum pacificum]TNY30734.1 SDR family NAD(P)-dependent oxidoreductase [Pelagovum pacificum]